MANAQTSSPLRNDLSTLGLLNGNTPDGTSSVLDQHRRMESEALSGLLKGLRRKRTPGPASLEDFCRERLKIADKHDALIPFNLWPTQQHYFKKKAEGRAKGFRHFILLKYRRGGFTTAELAESYRIVAEQPHARVVTLAQTSEDTETIFEIATRFYENDPTPPYRKNENKRVLHFPVIDTRLYARTAGGKAPGRGATLRKAHLTEVAFWMQGPDQDRKVRHAIGSMMQSASTGEIIAESTPNGANHFKTMYEQAKKGLSSFFPIFLPWYVDTYNRKRLTDDGITEIRDTITDAEQALIDAHGVTFEQIAFRREKQLELGPMFRQEYPENDIDCFLVTGHGYFNADLIADAVRAVNRWRALHPADMYYEDLPGGYYIQWSRPKKGHRYVMASDCSEGTDAGDPNGAKVIDVADGSEVAAFHGQFTPTEHAKLAIEVGRKFNGALWAVERENFGNSVLLLAQQNGYAPLYHAEDGKPGWSTNAITRPIGLETLRNWLVAQRAVNFEGLRDLHLLSECTTFKKQRSGKYEADSGAHDDAVMKTMIALEVRRRIGSGPSATIIKR